MVEVNMLSALLFVVIASCFLVIFYKLMSFWFIELLVVLFCIGGIEVWIKKFRFSYLLSVCCYIFFYMHVYCTDMLH